MPPSINRRRFIENAAVGSAAIGLSVSAETARAQAAPGNQVVVGVMGMNRGKALARSFARRPGVVVKYLCDADRSRAEGAVSEISPIVAKSPLATTNYQEILDDQSVDALICAAPNHWHAPATILACAAGKHVYCEKPCSHNPREGELMVQAARKHQRAVQLGTQRRSGPGWVRLIDSLRAGAIGRVYLARSWYDNARGSIGYGKQAPIPDVLDYDLWQGPAPRRPYTDNLVHYDWHWRWHWGNGELGNNGVHTLDLCRWGLGVDFPNRVTSSGGRYHFQDDQETPDTHTVCYEFEDRQQISWQGNSCNRHGTGFVTFYGDNGTIAVQQDGSFVQYDKDNREVDKHNPPSRGDVEHIDNFLAAIRDDEPLGLNAEIEEGHKSTLLCHLGNISHRAGRSLECDPLNGHIKGDAEAQTMWSREYEPGWEPTV